jgi:hypothetical protein
MLKTLRDKHLHRALNGRYLKKILPCVWRDASVVKANALLSPLEKWNGRCFAIDLSNFGAEVFFSKQALQKTGGMCWWPKLMRQGWSSKPGQPVWPVSLGTESDLRFRDNLEGLNDSLRGKASPSYIYDGTHGRLWASQLSKHKSSLLFYLETLILFSKL